MIHGIEAVTRPAGYQTLLAHYGYSPEREEEQVASLLSYNVDGLILSDTQHTERTRKMIATAGIPVVETMDLPLSPIDMVVGMDHRAAARAMVTEMLRRGRRKVIYLGARLDVRTQLRMEGYYQAMADFGLTGQHLLTEQSSSFTLGESCWPRPWRASPISTACSAPTTTWRWGPCCNARPGGSRCPSRWPSPAATPSTSATP